MRRGLILALLLLLAMPRVFCQDEPEGGIISQILQDTKPALLYDIDKGEIYGGVIASVANYKGLVSLDAGTITDMSSNAFLLGASANVQKVCDKIGLTFTLPDKVAIGGFFAKDFTNDREIFGISLSYKIAW